MLDPERHRPPLLEKDHFLHGIRDVYIYSITMLEKQAPDLLARNLPLAKRELFIPEKDATDIWKSRSHPLSTDHETEYTTQAKFEFIYPDENGETRQMAIKRGTIARSSTQVVATKNFTPLLSEKLLKRNDIYLFPELVVIKHPLTYDAYGNQPFYKLNALAVFTGAFFIAKNPRSGLFEYFWEHGSTRVWSPESQDMLAISEKIRRFDSLLYLADTYNALTNPFRGGLPGQNS